MQTQQAEGTAGTEGKPGKGANRPAGRRDSTGTPATMSTKPVKEMLKDLITLETKRVAATEKFNDQVNAVAEKAGFSASNLRRLVKAHAKDKFQEVKRDIEQLGILFDDVTEEHA